jgi:uncharacterized protein
MRSSPQTALVTGASSGIGRELAKLLAADGLALALVARDRAALEEFAREIEERHRGLGVTVVPADLADPATPARLVRELERAGIAVEVLVNNAGFGAAGRFAELDEGLQHRMVEVNVTALTRLTRLLLPPMLARGHGRILNVASTAAFQPGPGMAVYYATKAYVLSLSEALAVEVRGSGVTVTCLCPGPTRTAFFARAGASDSHLLRLGATDAAEVARAGHRGLMRGDRLVVPGARNRLAALGAKFAPRRLALEVTRRLNA